MGRTISLPLAPVVGVLIVAWGVMWWIAVTAYFDKHVTPRVIRWWEKRHGLDDYVPEKRR